MPSRAGDASRARSGVNARISSGRMPPGPPPAYCSRIRSAIAHGPPTSAATIQAKAAVPASITPICTMSVATTPRRPPVAEYDATTASSRTSEIRLLAVVIQTPGSPAWPSASGTPTQATRSTTGSNRPPGSQASQRRNGPAIVAAASSTQASTVQFSTVPK